MGTTDEHRWTRIIFNHTNAPLGLISVVQTSLRLIRKEEGGDEKGDEVDDEEEGKAEAEEVEDAVA